MTSPGSIGTLISATGDAGVETDEEGLSESGESGISGGKHS